MIIALIICLSISVITAITGVILHSSPKIRIRRYYSRNREAILWLFFIPIYAAIVITAWIVYVNLVSN